MLFRNACISDRAALQPRVRDQFSCKCPLRPFEGRPGAGILQRLLLTALLLQIGNLIYNSLFFTKLQAQGYRQHHAFLFLQYAVTVSEMQIRIGYRHDPFPEEEDVCALHHLHHFAAVRSGIHHDGAAHGSGDAGSKFQTGQSSFRCLCCQTHQLHARAGSYTFSVKGDLCQIPGQLQDHAAVASIGHQQVAAVAEQKIRDAVFFQKRGHAHQRFPILYRHKKIRGTAHAKGCVLSHRLIPAYIIAVDL